MTTFAIRTLSSLLLLLFLIYPLAAGAQAQDQDVQQLKDKLQRLEQEIEELKRQVAKDQGAPAPTTPPTPVVVRAEEEAQETPAAAVTEQEKRKNTVDIYGHVMLDSGYEFGQSDPNWFDVMRPTKLASFRGQFAPDGKTFFSVRQTRFGVKTSTPTGLGDLKTTFEFELFGTGVDAGQTTFRLRHAYGELGQFGAGQTWSPFMDIDVFPNSLEYWGPNGMVFFRNIQIRWTPIRSDQMQLVFAVERPGASADGGVYADHVELQGIRPKFDMPDFSMHARFTRDWGYLQLAAIFRKVSWVNTGANPPLIPNGDVFGWGINATSNIKFTKRDVGRFEIVYGAGIQNYMNDAPVDVSIKNTGNPIHPEGVALPMLGLVSFLDHDWSSKFSTSIGYSMLNIENSNAQLPSDFHQGHYALTNLLYHPVENVTVGGEFQFGRRVNFSDGFNVNDYRLQFSFKYNWKKGFTF